VDVTALESVAESFPGVGSTIPGGGDTEATFATEVAVDEIVATTRMAKNWFAASAGRAKPDRNWVRVGGVTQVPGVGAHVIDVMSIPETAGSIRIAPVAESPPLLVTVIVYVVSLLRRTEDTPSVLVTSRSAVGTRYVISVAELLEEFAS
jgi:hypothetical protein